MTPEQKQRIEHEISNWRNARNDHSAQLTGDRMASLLQELVDESIVDTLLTWTPNDDTGDITDADGNEYYFARDNAIAMCRVVIAAHAPAPSVPDGLTTCKCRWKDKEQVQQCEIHHNWAIAIDEWADRAKLAEAKLAALTPAEAPADEIERLRMQLAACGVAAMQNTRETLKERITSENPYYSASYGDVCRAVDREIAHREKLEDVARDAERLDWLEQEAKESRTGVSIVYKNQADDEGGIKRGYRLMRYHQIFSARLNLREAIDSAIAAEKGQS